jgi:acetyl/propionyl-CoA carboxylase alpha subunit
VDFQSAATVEFLVDPDGNHYFLEMNTRLQVEHGVTELVTGLDIVAWQIRVAAGEALDATVLDPRPAGHAIETRVYAEDPWNGFRPVAGTVSAWRPAEGPGVRIDHAIAEGGALTPEYDPLLAKLMVHAHDRPATVDRMRRALDETLIGGLQTDLGFHRWLVEQPEFVSGDYHTGLISERWADGPALSDPDAAAIARAAIEGRRSEPVSAAPPADGETHGPSAWSRAARAEALRRWPG